jgi:two-component system chemotaxis sensor kinase CheA
VFQHFPRLVREMAQELGRSVRLVIEGQTTEADKATVEALFEPLLHVMRNALGHGVEPEQERLAAGKPGHATVQLRAIRDGDQVIVEVTDDGRGIDAANVGRRAVRLGLVTDAVLAEMTDQAVIELIFSPGFSTAASVTSISGRGVGMDAVRTSVTRLGGRVTVTSKPGAGTSVRMTLPFTVMMLRVMTVEAGGQSFGIPIESIVETTRVPRDRIVRLGAADAIVLRERTVPLIRLTEVLGLPAADPGANRDARLVVVSVPGQNDASLDETEQIGALEVDALGERIDVMLKPMEALLAGVGGFAGTTVLGDGRVLIVLDLAELLR